MKKLWAPWRMEYINSEKKDECIFCVKNLRKEDEERYVLYRTKLSFVIMNKYPYNNGHLMIAPYKHASCLTDLKDNMLEDVFRTVRLCTGILKKIYNPEGFNTGINTGAAAGAGYKDHLHVHVVPRWNGDCNFMPVLGDTRVLSEHLSASYGRLKKAFSDQAIKEKKGNKFRY